MLKIRQYLCRHDYKYIAKHKHTMQNLWKCSKCGVYYIQHWGIGIGGKSKTPLLNDWIYEGSKSKSIISNDWVHEDETR